MNFYWVGVKCTRRRGIGDGCRDVARYVSTLSVSIQWSFPMPKQFGTRLIPWGQSDRVSYAYSPKKGFYKTKIEIIPQLSIF